MNLSFDQRQALENLWRARLEAALMRYQAATAEYRKMLEEEGEEESLTPESTNAVVRALQSESDARIEYERVLRTFTELTMYDKMPEGRAAAASGGGWS